MKKNMKMYSQVELNIMQEMAKKPLSTPKLAKRLARQFNRTYEGVYVKLLKMRRHMTTEPKVVVDPIVERTKTPVSTKSHTISSRPTKIEISDAGMTFYF
jgi:hypothetical protein